MLIRKEHTENGGLLGIWKMEEDREELLQLFPFHLRSEAITYLHDIRSESRSIEWLSTRVMLMELLGKEQIILNREDGSPYLVDGKTNISISHTKDYATILLHESYAVGIDIETRSERVIKISAKFISDEEYIDPEQKIVHQLLHWSAKESLFKLMNEQGIDFRQHLYIHPFTPASKGIMKATETKTKENRSFCLHYEVHPDYVLTWTVGNLSK
ncbi:4'-phosphopantetheinyl transferase family protein [Proteiniphilum sp. UBA1028]|jgi:phosphopantetheinyl transferase|uniref:4'-phosphopantetheinyl transferase family protein n=1 Tax=Proteiniphilum sp. UBA1028 TaxID=1947251 RepID=UPI000E8737A9|nr:4'-phosphopantetheinyl transferase superfamily protein [Proteiniphilum sp. UBA1028]HBG56830.1 siderophore biosynthesis protein [Porphyromonadaceae bacterium]